MEFCVDTAWKRGRRIVDVFHLANQMDCTQCKGLLDLRGTRRETRVGLASVLDILCFCGNVNRVDTDRRFKTEDEEDAYLVNTIISSSKYRQMMKMAPADLQHFLDMFCIPVTLPYSAVSDSSTPSPAAASMTCSDTDTDSSDTQTVTVSPGDIQSGVSSSNSRNLHLNDYQMSPSESAMNIVESYSKELPAGSGESIVNSRELNTLTSQTETSSDLSEEYFQVRKPELLHLQENDCFKQDSQHATELCENAQGVKVDTYERDSHPVVKSEDNHCNGEMTTPVSVGDIPVSFSVSDVPGTVGVSVSDVPVTVSASDVPVSVSDVPVTVSVSVSDVPVTVSASDVPVSVSDVPVSVSVSDVQVSVSVSGKTAPAHLVVRKNYKKSCKSGIKRKYTLVKLGAQRSDMPLEDMIQTFPVAATSNEPGSSQSDGTPRKRFQCRACKEQFTSEMEAYTHVRCHTGSVCLRCFRCGMEFKGKVCKNNVSRLEAHLNQHDDVRPYVCEVCAKTFQSSRQLKQHMTEVHNYIRGAPASQDSSLSCQQCSFKTHSQARLKVHRRSHTTKRERICDICGSILACRVTLKRHKQRLHDKRAEEYRFACELCEKRYRVREDLVKHQSDHRKGNLRAYQCQFCPKAFKTKKHLTTHERIHSGEKPQGVKVDRYERDSHPVVKSEDNHCNSEITTSVSVSDIPVSFSVSDVPGTVSVGDVPISVSVSGVPVSVSASDVPVSVSASDVPVSVSVSNVPATVSVSGKTALAHLPQSGKSGIKRKYNWNKLCFQRSDMPLEDMIQTFPVAATSDEPGSSQSDGSPRKRFQCRACNEQFTSEMKAYTHVRRHTGSHNLRCFRCGMEFNAKAPATNVSLLEVHLNQHDDVRPYVCEVCPKTYQSFRQHNQHMKEVHNYVGGAPASQDSSLSCQQCSYHTHSQARLKVHLRSHRTQRERICDVCGLILTCRVTLKRHKLRLHDKRAEEYRFACELCEKRYRVREDLVKHQSEHRRGDLRAYQCQFCPKTFKTKYHINTHERIHTGEKPHQCQLCDAAFVQNTSLKWHMKKHGAVK